MIKGPRRGLFFILEASLARTCNNEIRLYHLGVLGYVSVSKQNKIKHSASQSVRADKIRLSPDRVPGVAA